MTSDRSALDTVSQSMSGKTLLLVPHLGQALPDRLGALLARARPSPTLTIASDIDAALAQNDALVLAVIEAPVLAICRLLADGEGAQAALKKWIAQAVPVVQACRRARRRLVLVEANAAETTADALAEALCAHLGLTLEQAPADARSAEAGHDKPALASLEHLLAVALLGSNAYAAELADELEAMFVRPAPDRALSATILEQVDAGRSALRETFARLGGGLQEWRDLPWLAEELILQREALDQMADTLERAVSKRDGQQRENILARMLLARDNLLQDHEQLRDELARIHASRAWRLTQPLRAVARRLRAARSSR
ncbi:MAG: hypothetical protein ACK4LQ_13430 [Pararhodobacter sp.]